MEGGRQSRLLSRLLGRLRGDHHRETLDHNFSMTSTACSTDSAGFVTANDEEDAPAPSPTPEPATSTSPAEDDQFAANIDLRYGGQYLTPEQLPEFCNQLHHLVEVIRNIQSYAKVTGEYPSEMERLLEREAREVAALAGEARHARDSLSRTRMQRAALLALRQHLARHLDTLRHTEIRELENLVRVSDRKLYRSWEALKDSSDPAAFEPLLDEVKSKQTALEGLVRLINNRRLNISRAAIVPRPLPAPPRDDEESTTTAGSVRRRQEVGRRAAYKRRKRDATREPRSEPISGESSRHTPTVQVTVGQPTLELVTRASVRDILFFTSN